MQQSGPSLILLAVGRQRLAALGVDNCWTQPAGEKTMGIYAESDSEWNLQQQSTEQMHVIVKDATE